MEFTAEQQTHIDGLIAEAKTKAIEGFFSKEQLDSEVKKSVQSETDKVRTQLYSEKIKPLETELQTYKQKDKTPEQIKQEEKEAELAKKEAEINRKEKQLKISDILSSKNLPASLSKYMNIDIDDVEKSTGEFIESINTVLLSGSYKPVNHKNTKTTITKEEFGKMNYSQKLKLSKEQPEVYEILSKK